MFKICQQKYFSNYLPVEHEFLHYHSEFDTDQRSFDSHIRFFPLSS